MRASGQAPARGDCAGVDVSGAGKPRAADVARWVDMLAAEAKDLAAVRYDREGRRQVERRSQGARHMLARWGLDAQGNPKSTETVR